MAPSLSIVIPIYNAEDIVEHSVRTLVETLDQQDLNYEILLRDDGSTDAAREILEKISRRYAQVKCFFNRSNVGLGFTLRELFRETQGEHIIYCDCDLPFGREIIPPLLDGLKSYDIVVASRYRGMQNDVKLMRKLASRLYFLLCKLLFHVPVEDIGSGSVAVKRKALDRLDLRANGFDIHIEFYAKAARDGLIIKEIPVRTSGAGRGSFRILKHGPHIVFKTIGLWIELFGKRSLWKWNIARDTLV